MSPSSVLSTLSPNDLEAALWHVVNSKTKPVGSLGRLEALAVQIGVVQQTAQPVVDGCELLLFAADHGMAEQGVSHYPPAVTRQMVLNFLTGGAAASVFTECLGASLTVVDAGVAGEPIDHPQLVSRRMGAGTHNALTQAAMSPTTCENALLAGAEMARAVTTPLLALGEMGIGNTASASLIAAKILGDPVDSLVGRGTGLDDVGLQRKQELLKQAAARTPTTLDPLTALTEYGGFEIVMLVGAMQAAAASGKLVLVDGFIVSAAALAAVKLDASIAQHLVFAHQSAEAGHQRILQVLRASPLLRLDMRLGEGSGAVLAWPLVKSAAAMLSNMASFESAGVSGPADH